jgi:hypothetical protein
MRATAAMLSFVLSRQVALVESVSTEGEAANLNGHIFRLKIRS